MGGVATPPNPLLKTGPTKLDEAIAFLEAGAGWAQLLPFPGVGAAAVISQKILKLIQVAIATHEQVTGEALDLSKIHELPHV